MDVNYLQSREQIELIKARDAASPEARAAHAGLAKVYGAALAGSAFPHRDVQDAVPRRQTPPRRTGNA